MGLLDKINNKINEANDKVKEFALKTKDDFDIKKAFEEKTTRFSDVENILKFYDGIISLEDNTIITRSCDNIPERAILQGTVDGNKIKFQITKVNRSTSTYVVLVKEKNVEVTCDVSDFNILL